MQTTKFYLLDFPQTKIVLQFCFIYYISEKTKERQNAHGQKNNGHIQESCYKPNFNENITGTHFALFIFSAKNSNKLGQNSFSRLLFKFINIYYRQQN